MHYVHHHPNATMARDAIRTLFEDADEGDYLFPLWQLLRALRGPDSENGFVKRALTTPIRETLMTGYMAEKLGLSNDESYPMRLTDNLIDLEAAGEQVNSIEDDKYINESPHYLHHVRTAIETLMEAAPPQNAQIGQKESNQ